MCKLGWFIYVSNVSKTKTNVFTLVFHRRMNIVDFTNYVKTNEFVCTLFSCPGFMS